MITQKYSVAFRASLYGGIAGADDYKNLLDMLREARSSRQVKVDEQIRAAEQGGSAGGTI